MYIMLAVLEQFDDENLLTEIHLFSLNDVTTYESIKLRKIQKYISQAWLIEVHC